MRLVAVMMMGLVTLASQANAATVLEFAPPSKDTPVVKIAYSDTSPSLADAPDWTNALVYSRSTMRKLADLLPGSTGSFGLSLTNDSYKTKFAPARQIGFLPSAKYSHVSLQFADGSFQTLRGQPLAEAAQFRNGNRVDGTPESLIVYTAAEDGPAIVGAVFRTTAVPEPATWALMIGGFGLVGFGLRRRRLVMKPAL